jgi:hypothetical protein
MLRVVVLQRRLVRALCALPQGASVDQAWLQQQAWPDLDAVWVKRFWENQKGRRQAWLNTVAAAGVPAKQELLAVMAEQLRFRGLYRNPPTSRMRQTDKAFWDATLVRRAMKLLMLDFYEPGLSSELKFPATFCGGTGDLTREVYLKEPVFKVCPYCDNGLQCPELDHFLPKSAFPFLSVHPDNLIPSCHDSNRGDRKGDTPPLDWAAQDQAADHFHPRWRSAAGKFKVTFAETGTRELTATLEPLDPIDQSKVENLDNLFRLAEFWGRTLSDDIRSIQKEIADDMRAAGGSADVAAVRTCLLRRSEDCRRWLNRRPLQYYWQHLYAYAAQSDPIVQEILRQHEEDLQTG